MMFASLGSVSVDSLVGSAQKTESTISRRRGLRGADRLDRGQHDVVPGRVELAVGLVEQLERDRVGPTLVAGGNLRPERHEAIALPGDV